VTLPNPPQLDHLSQGRTPRQMWHIGLLTAGRIVAATTAEVLLYFALPLDDTRDLSPPVLLVIGLILLTAVVLVQGMAIVHSPLPGLRAVEALASAVTLVLLLFASIYVVVSTGDGDSFTEPLGHSEALYFSTTVLSTVGFGDISAASEPARLLVTAQMVMDLVVIGIGVKVLTGVAKLEHQRRRNDPSIESGSLG
jgi:voltage-gated potassium channel